MKVDKAPLSGYSQQPTGSIGLVWHCL